MARKVCCYLKNMNPDINLSIELPHDSPVVIGRMPELQITDKTCSRNQLELLANYNKRYVLVKRLGPNPSQIDGIEIHRNVSYQFKPQQKLYIINMKYPHHVIFEGDHEASNANTSLGKRCHKNGEIDAKDSKKLHEDVEQKKNHGLNGEATNKKTMLQQCAENSVSCTSNSTQHWSQGLKASMKDPESIIYSDDKVVAIHDKYPKAKFHWLVLPQESISSPYSLTAANIRLLQHILSVGQDLANKELAKDDSLQFRYGYHAVASMSQLHMHVISQDFDSASLKTKKHWNSFTTAYFVDAQDIIDDLEKEGKVRNRRSYTELLKTPLECHRCGLQQKNMPALKKHIAICKSKKRSFCT